MRLVAHRFLPVILTACLLYVGALANSWANWPIQPPQLLPKNGVPPKPLSDLDTSVSPQTTKGEEILLVNFPGTAVQERQFVHTLTKSYRGYPITNSTSLNCTLSGDALAASQLIPFVNNVSQSTISYTSGGSIGFTLLNEGANSLTAQYVNGGVTIRPLTVLLDRVPPKLQTASLVESPSYSGTSPKILVQFAEDDLDVSTVKLSSFKLQLRGQGNTFGSDFTPLAVEPDSQSVRLMVDALVDGQYKLTISNDATNGIRDLAGNKLVDEQTWLFSVESRRKYAEHVEFPPFAPPKAQNIPTEGFNSGDFVETRVARLYYYRDAHRVAQIINRNIRSYNQAAVTQAARRAENSRDEADTSTDARREAERQAVYAAQQARQKEQELAAAKSALNEARQAQSAVATEDVNEREIGRRLQIQGISVEDRSFLNGALEETKRRKAQSEADLQRFGGAAGVTKLENSVAALEQTVASFRQTELVREENSQKAAAKEERLRARQFRDEVTAAETDPDTYVAGNVNSIDPITQVSISVIGEGLIELRGPIKGINKIRTLINQIDSPVGQIKIGIFTVQVNGEKGEKMEKVVGEAENHVDLSRFLVNQSLNNLRRCVQAEAAMIAEQCAQDSGHYQVDRDRRYLYTFFGRDFIDELYAIDSEFLKTENTVLSLHAMDTISLNRALFILALAKNDVRERIVSRFLQTTKTELPNAEFDFRRSSELKPHVTEKKLPPWNRSHLPIANHYGKEDMIFEAVQRNALQRYHFRNFSSFFDTGFNSPDTMNPMQREFIRLAQIFKARLVAEMELKQRVLERGLIEDRSNTEKVRFEIFQPIQREIMQLEAEIQRSRIVNIRNNQSAVAAIQDSLNGIDASTNEVLMLIERTKTVILAQEFRSSHVDLDIGSKASVFARELRSLTAAAGRIEAAEWATTSLVENSRRFRMSAQTAIDAADQVQSAIAQYKGMSEGQVKQELGETIKAKQSILQTIRQDQTLNFFYESQGKESVVELLRSIASDWRATQESFSAFKIAIENGDLNANSIAFVYQEIRAALAKLAGASLQQKISKLVESSYSTAIDDQSVSSRLARVRKLEKETRVDLDHRKLLNHLIDEQEEKFIELVEGTRSHIAVLDDYLKRLSIALEDDFKLQFYDPAFVRVRESARGRAVTLSQVERTTILTNNRDFAKVDPQATMEFDLPKRQIAIKEAFDAARALVEDSGALMNDPTFLAAFQMMGGSKQPATLKNLLPTQSTVNEQRDLGFADPLQPSGVPGSALQNLVPEPSIFKLETGTGFQIRPVMQPDGDSVVYDFDYMYTTNIREPVRADEKHIGRVKRHFVHTAVQTGNFELREVSRYQVALKLARTSQGVPLLQDIPVVGAAFRPAPSAESSIQQNIIFGQTNVYPTLYDLMGLRWAQQVVDLDHSSLLEAEHVIRGRQKTMKDFVFGEAAKRVDDFLDIGQKSSEHLRPDLYHPQSLPSPHHPDGYSHPYPTVDPTGSQFERQDRRPSDMQDPPYDRLRHRSVVPESVELSDAEVVAPVQKKNLPVPTNLNNGNYYRRR